MKLAVTNQKGGVGKTTTSVNLAASLAAMHRRVLLVDLDPQGHATMGLGVDKNEAEVTVYDVLMAPDEVTAAVVNIESPGVDLIASNVDLTGAELELIDLPRREFRLADALRQVSGYDYVIIDCPPSLGLLTLNGLAASDRVLIPIQCEYYALEGLTALLQTIDRVTAGVNPGLTVEGIVRTMYDPRNSLTRDVSEQLSEHFADELYRTVIPRNVRLAEAPSYGLAALHYDKDSSGAKAYLALAGELVRRERERVAD
ncbi:MAG: chromosome partitioning protein [Gammaproteobacteria bacterium]|nr:chromosome partitioning protein [Gammaproteobacteria bacterium]